MLMQTNWRLDISGSQTNLHESELAFRKQFALMLKVCLTFKST